MMFAPAKRSYVPHRRRPRVFHDALHVTVHAIDGLPNLRGEQAHARIVEAIRKAQERFGCRVIEYSVLSNHLHLIVEAQDESKLAQAMKGLLVRIVRALNSLWKRKGSIFRERYHARVVRTMNEIRRAMRYVLLNARKHGIGIPKDRPDPCSSAPWFQRWRGREWSPFRSDASPVARPRTLNMDTALYGLTLDLNEVPGKVAGWTMECSWEELGLTT
jgi:REP element-mobilizing transposase RayT